MKTKPKPAPAFAFVPPTCCKVSMGCIAYCPLHDAARGLLQALKNAQVALDALALDAEEAGYPKRSENATYMAMEFRTLIAAAERKA